MSPFLESICKLHEYVLLLQPAVAAKHKQIQIVSFSMLCQIGKAAKLTPGVFLEYSMKTLYSIGACTSLPVNKFH